MPTAAANLAACDSSTRQELMLLFAAGVLLSLFIVFRLLRSSRKAPLHVGLQLCYLSQFWILHWIAVPIYFTPWYCGENESYSVLGARQSFYGLLGYTAGLTLVGYLLRNRRPAHVASNGIPASTRHAFLIGGLVFYVLSTSVAGANGFQALLNGGQFILLGALVMSIWSAYAKGSPRVAMQWLAISFLFPFLSMIRAGFLGFGIMALLPVMIFTLTWMPRKNLGKLALWGVVGVYLGLSLFVTYMRDRTALRASVWGEQTFSSRLDRLEDTFSNFELFSPYEPRHLAAIDGRLNQNFLVGAAEIYIDSTKQWAAGETLWKAALAMIPRLLWPDKPPTTSGALVSEYTGIQFAKGTSVGIGQVMEFYVNFGSPMVFAGFFVFGAVLAWLDRIAADGLRSGDVYRFMMAYLVGLSMQQIGGSLMEVVAAAGGSVVAVYLFKMIFSDSTDRRRVARPVPVAP
jgi:hypothetical protein